MPNTLELVNTETPNTTPEVTFSNPETSWVQDWELFKSTYSHHRAGGDLQREERLTELVDMLPTNNFLGEAPHSYVDYMFGCEIEFNGGDAVALGGELFDRGLTHSRRRQSYHSNESDHRRWKYESDASCSGEVISPILKDTPNAWGELRDALRILKDGGAVEGHNTGGHIHVDTTPLSEGDVPANLRRLGKIVEKFEDVIFRLSASPFCESETRRGKYHRFMYGNPYGRLAATIDTGRQGIINMNSVSLRNGTGHAEFRVFDGSLSFPVWVARTIIATSIIRAASDPTIDEKLDSIPTMSKGAHRNAEWRRGEDGERLPARVALKREAWMQDTQQFREFLDLIFVTAGHKEIVTALFALNDWNYSSPTRTGRRR